MKRFLALIFSLLLLFSAVPVSASQHSGTDAGTTGTTGTDPGGTTGTGPGTTGTTGTDMTIEKETGIEHALKQGSPKAKKKGLKKMTKKKMMKNMKKKGKKKKMESASSGTSSATPTSQTVQAKIENFTFITPVLNVKVGDSINWTNVDTTPHTVESNDGTTFKSGTLNQGNLFHHTFTTAGTFEYHCGFHSNMKATVFVAQ